MQAGATRPPSYARKERVWRGVQHLLRKPLPEQAAEAEGCFRCAQSSHFPSAYSDKSTHSFLGTAITHTHSSLLGVSSDAHLPPHLPPLSLAHSCSPRLTALEYIFRIRFYSCLDSFWPLRPLQLAAQRAPHTAVRRTVLRCYARPTLWLETTVTARDVADFGSAGNGYRGERGGRWERRWERAGVGARAGRSGEAGQGPDGAS